MTGAQITFGSLPLLAPSPSMGNYSIAAVASGTDFGNPSAVVAEVASMLMDGEKAEITRFGNRQATINLRVTGLTLDDVAAGEAAIMAEVNRGRNTLSWLPPGYSTASIFDVIYSTLDFRFDDLAEKRAERNFTLTLTCLPGARPDTVSTVVATPIGSSTPTTATVNACTATTGWTTGNGGTVALVGADGIRNGNTLGGAEMDLRLSGLSTVFSATDYIALEWDTDMTSFTPYFAVVVNGTWSQPALSAVSELAGSRVRWYYDMPAGTLSQFVFALQNTGIPSLVDRLDMYEVSKVDQLPFSGTRRQRSLVAEVGGTARTQADLAVEVGSGTIGSDLLLYTAPLGAAVSPPMRPWLSSSSLPVGNSSYVSGASHYFLAPSNYVIPAAQIPPGEHLIVARLLSVTTPQDVTFDWVATMSGSTYDTAATDPSGSVTVSLELDWKFFELGVVSLPTVAVGPTSAASVAFILDTTSTDAIIDELYLFNIDTGVLTWLTDLGDGGVEPTRAVVRAASLESPRPQWMIGTAGTSVQDISVAERATSPGIHETAPGTLSIFAVTPNSTSQTVTGTWYERFQTHVPALDS